MSRISRRTFVRSVSTATIGTFFIPRFSRAQSANEKLNIGIVGVANQGRYNLDNVASQNIVAMCDVDDKLLAKAAETFPHAKRTVRAPRLSRTRTSLTIPVGAYRLANSLRKYLFVRLAPK